MSDQILYKKVQGFQTFADQWVTLKDLPEEIPFKTSVMGGETHIHPIVCGRYIQIKPPRPDWNVQEPELWIYNGFCWEPSGPTVKTRSIMRGTCYHDAGYQLIKRGFLPKDPWKEYFDNLMHKTFLEDKVCKVRANYFLKTVEWFGGNSVIDARPVLVAP